MSNNNAVGFNTSMPLSTYNRISEYCEKTNQRKSKIVQDALNIFLGNTPEINEITRIALACQRNGVPMEDVITTMRTFILP